MTKQDLDAEEETVERHLTNGVDTQLNPEYSTKSAHTNGKDDEDTKPVEKRINVSAPKETVEYFDKIAAEYFRGNRSQLIRSSVYYYGRFLETGTTLDLDEIRQDLALLIEDTKQLESLLSQIRQKQDKLTDLQGEEQYFSDTPAESYEHAQKIRKVIKNTEDEKLSKEGIIEQSNLRPERVGNALEILLDGGFISERYASGKTTYKITK